MPFRAFILLALASLGAHAQNSCSLLSSTGAYAPLGTFRAFPASDPINTDISQAPVDAAATALYLKDWSTGHMHLDPTMPYNIVDSSVTPLVTISYDPAAYLDQSDVTPQPVNSTVVIEGGPTDCQGAPTSDQHTLIVDKHGCFLYETDGMGTCKGAYTAYGSTVVWDLVSNERRPYSYTSADAAGLPIFPLIAKYDEAAAGAMNHALRMTFTQTKIGANGPFYVDPATHGAGSCCWGSSLLMGDRIRLKASFDPTTLGTLSPIAMAFINTLKTYGAYVADNGATGLVQVAADPRWNQADLNPLYALPLSEFEVLQAGTVMSTGAPPTGTAPVISQLIASPSTVPAGAAVSLSWQSTGSYDYVQEAGPARGGSLVVKPAATTTYHVVSSNQFGRSTSAVTVNVAAATTPPIATAPTAPSNTATWVKIASEGDIIVAPVGTQLRFGSLLSPASPTLWITKSVASVLPFGATDGYFGSDPAPNYVKEIDALVPYANVTVIPKGTTTPVLTGQGAAPTPLYAVQITGLTCTASSTGTSTGTSFTCSPK